MKAEVPDHQNGFMQQLFAVLLFFPCRLHGVIQDVVDQVVELLLDLEVAHDLLGEAVVHAEDMINNLD